MRWSQEKNAELKRRHGITFEDLLASKLIKISINPARINQNILFFELNDYIWASPCVEEGTSLFLKTFFPSRKHTKRWKRGLPL